MGEVQCSVLTKLLFDTFERSSLEFIPRDSSVFTSSLEVSPGKKATQTKLINWKHDLQGTLASIMLYIRLIAYRWSLTVNILISQLCSGSYFMLSKREIKSLKEGKQC